MMDVSFSIDDESEQVKEMMKAFKSKDKYAVYFVTSFFHVHERPPSAIHGPFFIVHTTPQSLFREFCGVLPIVYAAYLCTILPHDRKCALLGLTQLSFGCQYTFRQIYIPNGVTYLCSNRDVKTEDAILAEIRKCTEAVNTNAVEHTAYIRAAAAKKDIDIDKFRKEVRDQMEKTSKSGGIV